MSDPFFSSTVAPGGLHETVAEAKPSSAANSTSPEPSPSATSPPPASISPPSHAAVAAAIGAELATPLSILDDLVHQLAESQGVPTNQKYVLLGAIERASRVGRQSQQIARMASFKPRQRYEQLALDAVLLLALAEFGPRFAQYAIALEQRIQSADVMVDPGLLSSLVDAVLSWTLDSAFAFNLAREAQGQEPDSRISITLENRNWPKRAVLFIKVSALPPQLAQDGAFEIERLSWYLTAQIAQAMQIKLEKISDGEEHIVMLEFSQPLAQPEVRRSVPPAGAPVSKDKLSPVVAPASPVLQKRLLLITEDEQLDFQVKKIVFAEGWRYEQVPTTPQAVAFCYLESPQMVLIDERLRDAMFEELRFELVNADPHFPLLEIAVHDNMFEMSDWDGNSLRRVHVSRLKDKLPELLPK